MTTWRVILGDCISGMATLPPASVHCCVTSPPYWGLRDYGVDGQIGLESTPAEYLARMVEVFRSVRRVLRDDGTLWVNMGDAYASKPPGCKGVSGSSGLNGIGSAQYRETLESGHSQKRNTIVGNLKTKDLIGMPWRLAFALQQPYYAGRIKNEMDRVWLAAMIEAEGCLFVHKRKAGGSNGQGYERQNDSYSPGLEVANTHRAIVERCMSITGLGSICSQSPDQNTRRKQTIHRWNLRTNECRDVIREVYPYFVGKQHQARLLCGCPSSGVDAERSHAGLKALHNGCATDIDFKPPASMHEPGWYLRSDVIWSKPNPMPESVTDRPTKSHEYMFLLSKNERYYFDQEAVKEDASPVTGEIRFGGNKYGDSKDPRHATKSGNNYEYTGKRNIRTVWTIPTQAYPGSHFATFPERLVEPCVKAGSPVGGLVLDPFTGSGTTGEVAVKLGRSFVGCELNPEYREMARERIGGACPLLAMEAA